ncbi:hypothetical protein [Amycolatopsis sp. RTGN1]|uniref:hypothetical protein n=1 Tax=Amycolatopsis ponsaeliensis TaxID=2992142 RepID=UPI00254BB426|nr:hypothetical protein [Amycolatopsis sp. RTGN1]
MTRRARRRRDRVTVDELLQAAGVRPRKPGSRSAEVAARRDPDDPEPRGAAGRIALASAVIVVLGGLVLALATRSDPVPGSTQFPQLQPATGVPTSTVIAVPTRTTTPSPVVMHARETPTPTPTVTIELPPSPTTTVTLPTFTPDYRCYPYGCRRDGTPVR